MGSLGAEVQQSSVTDGCGFEPDSTAWFPHTIMLATNVFEKSCYLTSLDIASAQTGVNSSRIWPTNFFFYYFKFLMMT